MWNKTLFFHSGSQRLHQGCCKHCRKRFHGGNCATWLAYVLTSQFTTFYAFLRLFDTYSLSANYVCAGLIEDKCPDQESGMKMKAKRPTNARTRMMLTLQLAVMLPAAVLVILSAWHLETVQRD